MRTLITVAILICSAALSGAQQPPPLADQLRKGIVQEEANQNLDKAIAAYQAIVAQYDQGRQAAATALYRLAECYRKTGKRDQAVAAYQRVIREFSDQAALVEPSRQQLASTFGISEIKPERKVAPAPTEGWSEGAILGLQHEMLVKQMALKAAERDMSAIQDKISDYQIQNKKWPESKDSTEYRQLRRDLEAARDRLELAQLDLREIQRQWSEVQTPSSSRAAGPREVSPKSSRAAGAQEFPSASQRGAGAREVTPESLQSMQIEMDVLQKQLEQSKRMVETGLLVPLDYQKLQARFEETLLRYQEAVKSRQASEEAARETQALNERLAKSLEDEITLLKNWIDVAERGVVQGTSADSPELLKLKRDLLDLQRKLDQVRTSIKR